MGAFLLENEASPVTVALIVTGGLLFARYLYLRSQRSADITPTPNRLPARIDPGPLPGSNANWLWPNRKQRLDKQTDFVRANTDYILARIEEAKAMGGLVRARMELAEILASLETPSSALSRSSAAPSPAGSTLTLQEISEIVHALPDVSSELRTVLMNLLAGRLAEKVAG